MKPILLGWITGLVIALLITSAFDLHGIYAFLCGVISAAITIMYTFFYRRNHGPWH